MAYVKTGAARSHAKKGSHHRSHLRPFEAYYNRQRYQAAHPKKKRRKAPTVAIPWELTYEDFIILVAEKLCHYCSFPLRWPLPYGDPNFRTTNLDRKDNRIGYTKDNCVPCCYSCNVAKSDKLSYEEMTAVGAMRRNKKEHPCLLSTSLPTSERHKQEQALERKK